jgi:hypothetical protein
VTDLDFRVAVLLVMEDGTPSFGDDLLGMEIDFSLLYSLPELDEDSVAVARTTHAERLISASCRPATGVSLDKAVQAVRDLWLTRLRYAYLEAHEVSKQEDGADLNFVTQIGPHRLYVTGQVHIAA